MTSTQAAVEHAVQSGLTPRASDKSNVRLGLSPKANVTPKKTDGNVGMFIATPKSASKPSNITDRLKND